LTWKFSFVSQGAETILGYSIARWYQEPHFWASIIHPEDRAGTLATCQNLAAEGQDHEVEYRAIAADGSIVWLRDVIRVIKDESGRPVRRGGVKIDITPLKQIEEALHESLKELIFLQEVNQLIMTAADPKAVLGEILRRCVAYGEFDLGTILLLGADGESLLTAAAHGYRDPANAERRPQRELPQAEQRDLSSHYQRTMIVEDLENGSRFRRLKTEGITTALIVPIGSGAGALGFLQLASRKKKKIDAYLIQISEAIAQQIGISIQKERLAEETRKNLARIQALYDINMSVTSSLDLNEVLTTLMEKIAGSLAYAVAISIRLVDKSSGRLEVAATLNIPKEDLVAHDKAGIQPLAAIIAARKQTEFIADVQWYADSPDPEFYRKHGLVSLIGVPLIVGGEVLGALVVTTREYRDVSKDDIDFVTAIGGHAAIAIHNAWLYSDLQKQAVQLEAAQAEEKKSRADAELLAVVSQEILAAEETGVWLDRVLQKCAEACGFDLGAIVRLENSGAVRRSVSSYGHRDPANIEGRLQQTSAGNGPRFRAADYDRSIVWENLQEKDRLRNLKTEGAQVALTVPLKRGGRCMGVLQLASRRNRQIDPHEIEICEAVAGQIAVGVEKADLLEETRQDLIRWRILHEINLAVTSTLELSEVAKGLLETLARHVPYCLTMAIWLIDAATGRLKIAASQNIPPDMIESYNTENGRLLSPLVAKNRDAVIVLDMQSDPRSPNPEWFRERGVRSYLGVPLIVNDECLGVLSVTTREIKEFNPEEVSLFKLIAGQAAVGIQNARLYRDIREQKEAVEKAKEIAAAAAAKSRFLAMVSHEIRTPLNAVIGLTKLLLETKLSADQRKMTETVKQSGEGLLVIINDVLDYSKIEADKLAIEDAEFDLRKAMSEVVDIMMPQARSKGLTITYTYPTNVPDIISGDAGRVRQVLLNLLSNAVKFAERGEVALRVELGVDKGDEALLGFKVKDSGIGIPADLQQRLFQPFSQGDSSTTRRFGGTGLGLAICRRLVELMGGVIGVESTEGQGSVFWFTMLTRRGSRAAVVNSDRAQLPPVTQQKGPKGGRVLLVEDNMANQMVATLLLEKLGYLWDVAANGIEALDAIGRASYDIILMDCDMPQMDGFQATQEVRKREQKTGAHVPIIAMTANAMQGDRERCLEAGMDDYMTKPISREDLRAALDQWQ